MIDKLLAKAPSALVGLIVDVVRAILGSPDPEAAARRAQEAARRRAFDETMRRAKPRKP